MNLRFRWKWLKAEFGWRVLGKRYDVRLTEKVQSQLEELPEEAQVEIRKVFERLSRNPYTRDKLEYWEEESLEEIEDREVVAEEPEEAEE